MYLFICIMFLQILRCGAHQYLTSPTAETTLTEEESPIASITAHPWVTLLKDTCTWTLRRDIRSNISLTQELRLTITQQICQSLGCGDVDGISETSAPLNSTCLSHCLRVDHTGLHHCSEVVADDCKVLTKVTCGHSKVRLVGADHRCGGRVEVWQGKQWGTVCDDDWDVNDANIVCSQLGCGYAVMVTGQDGRFGPGKGSILLDNLNCTGQEGNLWECPGRRGTDDCGHKEDAGVVCSEFKDVRLSGGLDRCSGRVEIHRNGTWGTVCDTCWAKEEANTVCSMLNCGRAVNFSAFNPPFTHDNSTKWFYFCKTANTSLWPCEEFANHPAFCADSKAAGLICENSLGLPPTPTQDTTITRLKDVSPSTSTVSVSVTTGEPLIPLSLEQLGCVGLSAALLIALIANIIICCRYRRQDKLLIQRKHPVLQSAGEHHNNDYGDSIDLVNVTSNNYEADHADHSVETAPSYYPQSSIDSSVSYDTDRDGSLSVELAYPLSTFRNSRKYSSERRTPTAGVSHMSSLTEEACNPAGDMATLHAGYLVDNCQPNRTSYAGTASVDSFDSSSTSSGECYENVEAASSALPDIEAPIYDQTDDFLQHDGNHGELTATHTFSQGVAAESPSSGEDSPLYSPVSMEPPEAEDESDCDYDDVDYLQ
ncbi:T-cell differentiation antigen CD6-like [Sardina pilchardus]|uniref:T-cell differentiation antigen CD6-like n=1 Tax=Sardina pilchardus TaxID=27697 RepID=UPI002E1300E5